MHILVVKSGSRGNCTYIGNGSSTHDDTGGFLVDCGITHMMSSFSKLDIKSSNIRGAFFSHAHTDHIRPSVVKQLEKWKVPMYVPFEWEYRCQFSSRAITSLESVVKSVTEGFQSLAVSEIQCAHDAPCTGYRFKINNKIITCIPDTAVVTLQAHKSIETSDIVMIDCNYDTMMIQSHEYPVGVPGIEHLGGVAIPSSYNYSPEILRRIKFEGHLSLQRVISLMECYPNVAKWVLMHLSNTFAHPSVYVHYLKRAGVPPAKYAITNQINSNFVGCVDIAL